MTDSEGCASIFLIPFPVPILFKKPVVCLLTTRVKTPRKGGNLLKRVIFYGRISKQLLSCECFLSLLSKMNTNTSKTHPLVTAWNLSISFNWFQRPKTSLIIWISRLNNTINESACWLQPQIYVILYVFAHLAQNTSLLYMSARKKPLQLLFECPRNVTKYIYSDTVFPLSLYFYFTRFWWQILYLFW